MLKVKFFHTPKAKKFNYTPLYYNPEEEEKQKRREKSLGQAAPGESIRGQFTERRKRQSKTGRMSNLRVFIIIGILLVIAYYLIFDTLPFL